jgi:hypothetical protein
MRRSRRHPRLRHVERQIGPSCAPSTFPTGPMNCAEIVRMCGRTASMEAVARLLLESIVGGHSRRGGPSALRPRLTMGAFKARPSSSLVELTDRLATGVIGGNNIARFAVVGGPARSPGGTCLDFFQTRNAVDDEPSVGGSAASIDR